MPETSSHPTKPSEATDGLAEAAARAEAWAGEPFLWPEEDPADVLAPGRARRMALDEALEEMAAGRRVSVARVEGAPRPHAGARAGGHRPSAAPCVGHRAAPPPDRRARRHAHRADCEARAASRERQRERQRPTRSSPRTSRRAGSPRGRGGRGARARRPGRRAALPLPPPDRIRQDDRRGGVRRSRPHDGRPDPHAPPAARDPVQPRPDDRGLRRPVPRGDRGGPRTAAREPDHDPDLRLVRAPRRFALAQRLPARHLRRGPHGARREDERCDPQLHRAALHRHDRDRAADRQAGLRRLPRLGRRPPARRRRAARADRAAALAAHSPRGRHLVACRSSAATTTRMRWPRCSTTS